MQVAGDCITLFVKEWKGSKEKDYMIVRLL